MAALASRGKASQLTRAAKTSANGPKMVQAAAKWKDRSTALTTAGAGVGGVGAYNFASYTNADAKKQAKLKKNADPFGISKAKKEKDWAPGVSSAAAGASLAVTAAKTPATRVSRRHYERETYFRTQAKRANAHQERHGLPGTEKVKSIKGIKRAATAKGGAVVVGAGIAGAAAGAEFQRRVSKSDPFGVSKLGGPKVRFQEITSYSQGKNTTTQHDADTVTTRYKGKSLILRRPKYQAIAHPSDAKLKRSSYASATPNHRTTREAAATLAAAHEKKSKTVKLGTHKVKHVVAKADAVSAFGIDHGY